MDDNPSLEEKVTAPFFPDVSLAFHGNPFWPAAFFTGPLFITPHDEKLYRFYETVETPLDVLKDERRKEVLEVFRLMNPSPSLFTLNGEMDHIAEDMLAISRLYNKFKIKIGKKVRDLAVPKPVFRNFLTEYVLPFVKSQPVHQSAHGGERGWSIAKSLTTHLPIRSYISFDMSDAFRQATINHIFGFYYNALENIAKTEEGRVNSAGLLAALSSVARPKEIVGQVRSGDTEFDQIAFIDDPSFSDTRRSIENMDGDSALPQGSPLSTALFNRIMLPIDQAFNRYATKKGMTYSRWIDDFVISSPSSRSFEHFAQVLRVAQMHFSLAPDKVFYKRDGHAYLLGHRIEYDKLIKIDKETFNRERGIPFTSIDLADTHPRGSDIYDIEEYD